MIAPSQHLYSKAVASLQSAHLVFLHLSDCHFGKVAQQRQLFCVQRARFPVNNTPARQVRLEQMIQPRLQYCCLDKVDGTEMLLIKAVTYKEPRQWSETTTDGDVMHMTVLNVWITGNQGGGCG